MSNKPTVEVTAELPQNVRVFKPTSGMILWLDAAVELATESPTKISAKIEQRRENFYDWMRIPGFEEWFYEGYKSKRRRWLPTLDKIGMKYAKEGKYDFWKDMNKKAGEDLDNKDNKVQVNIVNAIQEQKNKYGI